MEGRIGRSTYLGYSIGIALIEIIIFVYIGSQETSESLYSKKQTENIIFLLYLLTVIAILALLYISVLRLHDINYSGWYALLALIPIINIAGIALFFIPGTKGPNKYGAGPKSIKKNQTQQRQSKQNPIDQEKYDLQNALSTTASQMILLDNGLNSGLITEIEFSDKVGSLTAKRKNIELRLEKINENIKETELINKRINDLEVLRSQGLLSKLEFDQKVKVLNHNETNHLKNTSTKSNFDSSNDDRNQILSAIITVAFIILLIVLSVFKLI